MTPIVVAHRAYYLVVLCFTAWVGYIGFFRPEEITRALPWTIPPLHARVIGAVYLAATVFLSLSFFAKHLVFTRTILRIAGVWTGWLLLVSAMHWQSFDPAREQTWFWLFAYLCFPVTAAALSLWARRVWTTKPAGQLTTDDPVDSRFRSTSVAAFLWLTAAGFAAIGLLMFFAPAAAARIWPWTLPAFIAQIYSGPLIGLAVGAADLAKRRSLLGAPIPLIGLLALSTFVLVASSKHRGLFPTNQTATYLWFLAIGVLGFASALSLIAIYRETWRAANG